MKKRANSKSNAAPKGLEAKLRSFNENIFRPVDALPLGIFRFLFGFLLCVEFLVLSRESFPSDYIKPLFHFTYPLFDLLGLKPLSKPYLWLLFYVLRISAVGIMLGLFTRISLILFTTAFGYFFFMESAVYTNHYYLIFLLSFLMCFGHSGAIFSIDSLINTKNHRERVDYWEIFLLRFQICVVFLFGALAKMNADWLVYAAPLYLNLVKHLTFLGYPLQEKWMAFVLSWAGMLSDLGLGILLAINRLQKLTFLWLCLFNGLNVFFFGLGIQTFPYLMVSSYILFLRPSTVREFATRWVRPGLLGKYIGSAQDPTRTGFRNKRSPGKVSQWIPAFVVVYVSLQLLTPLRHLLYKRDLQWTHEGIDFSWRMMADHHETDGSITVEDPRTKDVYLHSPETLLSRKQLIMVNNPYMLVQYVQFLKQYLSQQSGIKNPIIRADTQVSVNGRPFQRMFDPTCNLSGVTYSRFKDLSWVIPLKKN